VTALRGAPRGRVKVELDGAPWRTVPVDVVLAAGLHVGLTLDRERLRIVRRELRSREALSKAARLLARRDLSEQGLGDELERRRVAPAARRETISRLLAAGAVDDERLATHRAALLAARGGGDALIRADLEARGLRRRARPARRRQADLDADAAPLQVQRMGVSLRSVADDRDLLALNELQVSVLVVVHLRHHVSPIG